jgi:hypothetical protein
MLVGTVMAGSSAFGAAASASLAAFLAAAASRFWRAFSAAAAFAFLICAASALMPAVSSAVSGALGAPNGAAVAVNAALETMVVASKPRTNARMGLLLKNEKWGQYGEWNQPDASAARATSQA